MAEPSPEDMLEMLSEYSESDYNDEQECYFEWGIDNEGGWPVIEITHTDMSREDDQGNAPITKRKWRMVEL